MPKCGDRVFIKNLKGKRKKLVCRKRRHSEEEFHQSDKGYVWDSRCAWVKGSEPPTPRY